MSKTRYISVRVEVEVLADDEVDLREIREDLGGRAHDAIYRAPSVQRIHHVGTVTRRPHETERFESGTR